MDTKASDNNVDTDKLREMIREEVQKQFRVSRFKQLQQIMSQYRDNADYESEEELLEDIS